VAPATDQYLMTMVLQGQVELFDELVKRHRSSLMRAAVSKMRDMTAAEDVIQDTFLAAYARRVTFNPEYSFRGWLWTIMLNTARTHLALERRRRERLVQVASNTKPPITHESGLGSLLKNERSELLAQMLERIPEVEADALRMRFFGELQFNEIAEAMSVSLNGARKRIRRGLERLADALRELESTPFDGEIK
jgi:RNA polymerase sigma-70 factor, ECF subfamily